jgi:hypothetical protein
LKNINELKSLEDLRKEKRENQSFSFHQNKAFDLSRVETK